jgi:hypothetical protein
MAKYDDMSFKKAFAAARKEKGAGKVFTWKGKRYTTNYKEEESKAPAKSKRPTKRPTKKSEKSSGPPRRSSRGGSDTGRGGPPRRQGRGSTPMSTNRLVELTERALDRSRRSENAREASQMVIDQAKALRSEGVDIPDDVFNQALEMAFDGKPVSLRQMLGSRQPRVTFAEWERMSRAERERRGLPVSTMGWQNQNVGRGGGTRSQYQAAPGRRGDRARRR